MPRKESDFVRDQLKPRLEAEFPGCVIIKQDPNVSFQGVPDHLVLFEDRWAALESKRARDSSRRQNQEYHIDRLNEKGYASFVHPDNLEEVVHDLQRAFGTGR